MYGTYVGLIALVIITVVGSAYVIWEDKKQKKESQEKQS